MNNLLKPYLVGCLIGDGGLCGNLTFASLDQDIIDRVNLELASYNYVLVKRSTNPKRKSEYTIKPKQNHTIKYLFTYNNITYKSINKLLADLQKDGFPITSHDTLLSIVGKSSKTKKSSILTYFPELATKLHCTQIKADTHSPFIDQLNSLHLRCKFDQKRIPEIYFNLSFTDRLDLFHGLTDTDGSVSSNKRLEFCVANKLLAEDFARLAESLGYTYKIYKKQSYYFNKKYNEKRLGKLAYRVLLDYNPDLQPFYCKRKLEMYNKNIGVK